MKKACILIAVLLLFSFVCNAGLPVQAAEQERYGYTLLTSDAQRTAYKAVVSGIGELKAEISFTIDGITQDNVNQIFDEIEYAEKMVVKDYPEYFWYTGGCEISITGSDVTLKPDAYKVAGNAVTAGSSALTQAKSRVEQAISAALASIPGNPSDYEIAHVLHDYLINKVEYLEVGDHQTAYGALVNGKAVCAGYARAYQLLMNRAGIRCTYICGDSFDPNGNKVPHAWNLLWLDGKCYYTDVTWDDQNSEIFHEYFNMSKEEMDKTHFADPSEILPSGCHHDDYRFFIKNRGQGICDIQNTMSDSEIANCFELKSREGNQAVYYCTVHYHGDDFLSWFNQHHQSIATKLGYTSYGISYIELGHEHHITYSGDLRPAETTPSQSAPTTPPTTATPSAPTTQPTVATQPAPTTKPTQPAPTTPPTVATQPVSTTQPTVATQPAATAKPTSPTTATAPTQRETEPTAATQPTQATNPSAPVAPTGQTQATTPSTPPTSPTQSPSIPATENTPTVNPTQGSTQAAPNSTEESVTVPTVGDPSPTNPADQTDSEGSPIVLIVIISVVLVGAAAGAAVFFVIRKRKA